MYIEMNPTGLTLSDLICVAHRKRSEDTGFPYLRVCRDDGAHRSQVL